MYPKSKQMTVADLIIKLTVLPDHSLPVTAYLDGDVYFIEFIDDTVSGRIDLNLSDDIDSINETIEIV